MTVGLRERLAAMSDTGVSFADLVDELNVYKDGIPARQYDELWLFCWTLAKRRAILHSPGSNGEAWPDLANERGPQ
jgi:hypothetical protein